MVDIEDIDGRRTRSLLAIRDLSPDDLEWLVRSTTSYSRNPQSYLSRLSGHRVGLIFTAPSTRTKASSWAAAQTLGCKTLVFGPNELQVGTGEEWADTGAMLRMFLDSLIVRTDGRQEDLVALSLQMPRTINGLTKLEHPTQAIADACTIQETLGPRAKIRLAYFGILNNTARSLAWLVAKTPSWSLDVYSPSGLGFSDPELSALNAEHDFSDIQQHSVLPNSPRPVDVVYTCRWHSMGKAPDGADSVERLRRFRVDEPLMRRFSGKQDAVLMHDLPATRDLEVDSKVLDGTRSVVLRQARNKESAAAASLLWTARHDQ